jgi:polysaccharide biosynthesis protein PslG
MRYRGILLATVLAATAVAVAPLRAEAAPNPYSVELGVAVGPNQRGYTQAQFGGMKNMGASWVRIAFSWKDIEEVRGVRTWSQTDLQVANARAKGLQVLGVLSYTPPWAEHPDCPEHPCAPAIDKLDDFALFASRAAARYNGKVAAWEIWNEPNETQFHRPKPMPAVYANLLRQTYRAIKNVAFAKVVFGGLSTHPTNTADWMTWRTFMDKFYAAGGAPFDVFAIHPYYANNVPMHPSPDNPFYNLPKVRDHLASHGAGSKKIWLTEFGYVTGALTPKKQGERLRAALTQVVKWSFVERMFVFAWMDFMRTETKLVAWGLNDQNGVPKESRWMLRALVQSHAT